MPYGLRRLQQSGQSHFVTFTCYHRRTGLVSACACDLLMEVLESMRRRFALRVYGFVVMPEHVHLLLSEPERGVLADAIHYLKLASPNGCGADAENYLPAYSGKNDTMTGTSGTNASSRRSYDTFTGTR